MGGRRRAGVRKFRLLTERKPGAGVKPVAFPIRRWGLALGLAAAFLASPVAADDRNALWRVVHDLCVTDMKVRRRPAPCLAVNCAAGYAVVPDPRRRSQVLLVPTARVVGIESPAILVPDAVNYWQAAWEARSYVERRLRRPLSRDRTALAINSALSRSQDQLHIHVDCVRPDVRQALQNNQAQIGDEWIPLPLRLPGHAFQVRRLTGEDLSQRNPFALLVEGDPAAAAHMGRETLAVVGAVFADGSPGFYLLSDQVDLAHGNAGFGEGLLDHSCAVLDQP